MSDFDEMDDLIKEFLVESYENLDQMDRDLIALEQEPAATDHIASIFRSIHTIKGTCGMLGFPKLESVTHVGENLLVKVRDGILQVDPPIASAMLAMTDAVRDILNTIESTDAEGDADYDALIKTLGDLQEAPTKSAEAESAPAAAPAKEEEPKGPAPEVEPIIKEFLLESYENLDQLDRDLLSLEQNPKDPDTLARIFRLVHTVKGSCGFLAFNRLEAVAHAGENLLSDLREGKLEADQPITTALLSLTSAVRKFLAKIEATGTDDAGDHSELIQTLEALKEGKDVEVKVASPVEEGPTERLGEILVTSGATTDGEVAKAARDQADGDPRPIGEILVDKGAVEPTEVEQALQRQTEQRGPSISDSSIRVEVGQLDKLMNLVGELVLARNQVLQYTATIEDAALLTTSQRLNLITTELQEGIMKTRMQPIGNVWRKFPRIVRDMSVSLEKKIRIEMEGKETELDKTIIEAIKDPLTHVIRNSVDHGIESPEERVAAGKPEEGKVMLRAFHEGGQVIIEISDDGAGIDPDRLKQKAVECNIISQERASRMTEREVINLIFNAGFSMAKKVTNISGRGVGMDVVKTNIEKIGGTVDVFSKLGKGTTLRVKIPLTLAIIPALMVKQGNGVFAIPQVSLLELVRLEAQQALTAIEYIHGAPVYRLRGTLLPLVYMDQVLDVARKPNEHEDQDGGEASKEVNIVVLQADDQQFGLVVEDIHDTEEIVVKPLGKQLKDIDVFAGATIMGNGSVALILDVLGIAQRSGVLSEHREDTGAVEEQLATSNSGDHQTLLLFGLGEDRRVAVPLSAVDRLEEIVSSAVEHTGDRDVIQYRGQIMPLIHLADSLGEAARERDVEQPMQVIVYTEKGRSIGMVVDQILDIVDETLAVKRDADGHGIVGSAVVQDRVTDLLDVKGIIEQADPGFYAEAAV